MLYISIYPVRNRVEGLTAGIGPFSGYMMLLHRGQVVTI